LRKRWTRRCHFDESQKRRHYTQEVIDKYDGIIRKSFADFGISFDNYSRTSAKIHHDTASEFLENYTTKATLLKKLPSNYMMRKLISFWPTDL
jgi:methionyl-tRNA synthetase